MGVERNRSGLVENTVPFAIQKFVIIICHTKSFSDSQEKQDTSREKQETSQGKRDLSCEK